MRIRAFKGEVAEMEGREVERDKFYEMKSSEMGGFKDQVSRRVVDCRSEVQSLRISVSEVRPTLLSLLNQSQSSTQFDLKIYGNETRPADII